MELEADTSLLGQLRGDPRSFDTDPGMRLGRIDFPIELVNAAREGRLVVFAGAGVSRGAPSNLPLFPELAGMVAKGTTYGLPTEAEVDRFLGKLEHSGVRVHDLVAKVLDAPAIQHNQLHSSLLRVFRTPNRVRLVTTNFDELFESAAASAWSVVPEVYCGPALPLGHDFLGIVHVHGSLTHPSRMVLTDADFGRAYLTLGWARRFLLDVFRTHVVLFVGYSHDDTVMRYLARALPPDSDVLRYALDQESPERTEKWNLLGVLPVPFPRDHDSDFSALYSGIEELAALVALDPRDWHLELGALASKPPPPELPSSQAEADRIVDAIADPSRIHFFLNQARDVRWLDWLDRRQLLDPLFSETSLTEQSQKIADWLTTNFALEHPDRCFGLIGRHRLVLNRDFWQGLVRHLGISSCEPSVETMDRWVQVLLESQPVNCDVENYQFLVAKCSRIGAVASLMALFREVIGECTTIKSTGAPQVGEVGSADQQLDVERQFLTDHWTLKDIWAKHVTPHLDEVAQAVLSLCIDRLETRFSLQIAWASGAQARFWDNYRRAAIESHDQNQLEESMDAIIDMARDSLAHLLRQAPEEWISWCRSKSRSPSDLVRRIVIHAVGTSSPMSCDERIEWMTTSLDWQSVNVHHEVFLFLKAAFPSASISLRQRIVNAVLAYKLEPDGSDDRVEDEAYVKANWLHWLRQAAPDCPIVRSALDDLLVAYPQFGPREHPDLLHWTTKAEWTTRTTTYSADALLALSPNERLAKLGDGLAASADSFGRRAFLESVVSASRKDLSWSFAVADSLAAERLWDSLLWDGLIEAWADWPSASDESKRIVIWLGCPQLVEHHATAIADTLYALVRDGGRPNAVAWVDACNEIARRVWNHLPRSTPVATTSSDWIQGALTSPGGVMALYWINAFSVAAGNQGSTEPMCSTLAAPYLAAFTSVVEDVSDAGDYGRSVVASQLAFLESHDVEWATERLVPLFSSSDDRLFAQAWDGFLTWGRVTPTIAASLEPAFQAGLPRMRQCAPRLIDRFIQYYVACICWCVSDPLERWIPSFFQHADEVNRRAFASEIGQFLRGLDEDHQVAWWNTWLQAYWQNRLFGRPAPLQASETAAMVEWAPLLPAVFESAVNLVVQSPSCELRHSLSIFRLTSGDLIAKQAEAVARYVVYVLENSQLGSPPHGTQDVSHQLLKARKRPAIPS